MKKASITFTVLAFVFFAIAIIRGIATPPKHNADYFLGIHPGFYIIGVAFYVLFGLIAHILANKYRAVNGGGLLAVYILTIPAYIAPFIILFALYLILKFIDIMLDLFTDGKCSIASATNFLYTAAFGKPKKAKIQAEEAFVVIDGGNERRLQFLEQKQDNDSDSPLYTEYYSRFRDDAGNFWRSYDNNQTFIKETYEQISRGY